MVAVSSCCCDPAPDDCRSGFITDSLSIGTFDRTNLDSIVIQNGLTLLTSNPLLRSVIVVRNGEQVVAWGNLTDSQYVASVTKSVVSLLIGIAVKKNQIDDIDDPIRKYLPAYFTDVTDPLKRSITVRHLLSMQHGLQWNEASDRLLGDYVQFAVDLPMDTVPGTTFTYSSAAYHLLSAVLTQATSQSTLAFAESELFDPLDIHGVTWLTDPQGISLGGGGLYLRPHDMAKIAMMTAQCGQYHYEVVVPSSWIAASTSAQVQADRPYEGEYGFGWWVTTYDGHDVAVARGFGGQTLYVVPDVAVVVATTGTSETVHAAVDTFVTDFVLSAIRDSSNQGGL